MDGQEFEKVEKWEREWVGPEAYEKWTRHQVENFTLYTTVSHIKYWLENMPLVYMTTKNSGFSFNTEVPPLTEIASDTWLLMLTGRRDPTSFPDAEFERARKAWLVPIPLIEFRIRTPDMDIESSEYSIEIDARCCRPSAVNAFMSLCKIMRGRWGEQTPDEPATPVVEAHMSQVAGKHNTVDVAGEQESTVVFPPGIPGAPPKLVHDEAYKRWRRGISYDKVFEWWKLALREKEGDARFRRRRPGDLKDIFNKAMDRRAAKEPIEGDESG
ncbi:MAG TPA: hypothetical protein VJ183_02525 [Chloroflexia bacterium]|nr:hypothetical protein [Chloroflexia bacterium]